MSLVYLSLGGNIGDTVAVINDAFRRISELPGVTDIKISHFYRTSPVDADSESDYINAACRFLTSRSLISLWNDLQQIERALGKTPKDKRSSRIIDIDIILFGNRNVNRDGLEIPHPRWHQRLFVLVPLADLDRYLFVPGHDKKIDLNKMIAAFPKESGQQITQIS